MAEAVKKFVRPKEGRMLGGVSGAIANYFNIDVNLVRIGWILLLLPGGFPAILPYVILWVVFPEA